MNDTARLRWRCRRGIREMDLLLEAFMEKYYQSLRDADKQAFEALLDESDPDLLDWISGRSEPDNAAYHGLLTLLKSLDRLN